MKCLVIKQNFQLVLFIHYKTTMNKSTASATKSLHSIFDLPTIDLIDRVGVMLSQESQSHYITKDYLKPSSRDSHSRAKKSITPVARAKIVRWLYDIVDYFELERTTVAMAMSYMDRFMSTTAGKSSRSITSYQLSCLACVFLATKTIETAHLDVDLLVKASRGCYNRQEILDAEKEILDALNWRVCDVTPSCLSSHLLGLLIKVVPMDSRTTESLVDFTRFQVELSVAEYTCALRRPSTIALAAVLNSMELLDFTSSQKAVYHRVIQSIGLSFSSRVREACNELNMILDRQSEDITSRMSTLSVSFRSADSAVTPLPLPRKKSMDCDPSPTCVDRISVSRNRRTGRAR